MGGASKSSESPKPKQGEPSVRGLTSEQLCRDVPLYDKIAFDPSTDIGYLKRLEAFRGPLDCYCETCGNHSVFSRAEIQSQTSDWRFNNGHFFGLMFSCARNDAHKVFFMFRSHDAVLQKVGQYPSRADLELPDLQKYRKVLGAERYREFSCGVGLAAHGVGIGAFVYLRRIFESLIDEAKTRLSKKENWEEGAYQKARMEEKIKLLAEELPEFLVNNHPLYSILSIGVHSLDENTCLSNFPLVKTSIELILDEELSRRTREEKVKAATNGIAQTAGALKKVLEGDI